MKAKNPFELIIRQDNDEFGLLILYKESDAEVYIEAEEGIDNQKNEAWHLKGCLKNIDISCTCEDIFTNKNA
jgi:hypothetical protein